MQTVYYISLLFINLYRHGRRYIPERNLSLSNLYSFPQNQNTWMKQSINLYTTILCGFQNHALCGTIIESSKPIFRKERSRWASHSLMHSRYHPYLQVHYAGVSL